MQPTRACGGGEGGNGKSPAPYATGIVLGSLTFLCVSASLSMEVVVTAAGCASLGIYGSHVTSSRGTSPWR